MAWSSEDYNDGEEFPLNSNRIRFWKMELCSHEKYLYWKLSFLISDLVSSGSHLTCVACYLDGEIAKIEDHKVDEVDLENE